jgi:ABC-2 type transport system ATP-binding protein
VRTLMRTLAGEGRTVFVSSHLLAEMSNTADRLVVIGRGKLIGSTTVSEFVGRADTVRVRSPQLDLLRQVLTDAGIGVEDDAEASALLVRGAASDVVGELAARNGITLHELTSQQVSLEDAYMKLTDDAVQYRAAT